MTPLKDVIHVKAKKQEIMNLLVGKLNNLQELSNIDALMNNILDISQLSVFYTMMLHLIA